MLFYVTFCWKSENIAVRLEYSFTFRSGNEKNKEFCFIFFFSKVTVLL